MPFPVVGEGYGLGELCPESGGMMSTNVVQLQTQMATFDDFWRLCPKKVGKPIAEAKWRAITSPQGMMTRTLDRDSGLYIDIHLKATPEELIAGMKRYCMEQCPTSTWEEIAQGRARLKDGGKYTCHPSTWLNQGRWML